MIAHNAPFDVAFIEGAFFRTGSPLASGGLRYADTMELAERLGLPRKLGNLCAQLGIFYDPHCALDDARATLEVFRQFLPRIEPSSFGSANPAEVFEGVPGPRGAPCLDRATAADLLRPRDLVAERAFEFHPVDAAETSVDSYRTAVRRQLASGVFTAEIGAQMVAVAIQGRLSAAQARDVHHDALSELFDTALADNRVSKAERLAIETAAAWLGVPIADFDAWVKAARARRKASIKEFRDRLKGQTVVITGRGIHPTNIREALAAKHGFAVTGTFKPSALFVVLGSETVAATEARQAAHDHGVETLLEIDFWRRCGEL